MIDKYLLFDGAFGTYYGAVSGNNQPPELANINDSSTVIKIHKEYIDAGAMAIKTNTFGICHAIAPSKNEQLTLVRKGWENACAAAKGSNAFVFADIGPATFLQEENIEQFNIEIIDAFIACGAKNFIFETFPSFVLLEKALEHIKEKVKEAYIIVSFAVSQDGYSSKGNFYTQLFSQAQNSGFVDAVGLNCVCGPTHLLHLINQNEINTTLSIMPNAGYPATVNGRTIYIDNAQYFAEKLAQMQKQGVKILGGCCGTTPAHIKAVSELLKGKSSDTIVPTQIKRSSIHHDIAENSFREKLEQGKKVIAVELDPPSDTNYQLLHEKAMELKNAGIDVITFADSPLARTRADSIMTAAKIKRDTGLCVLPHLSCRDRNIIAIKAALLGGNIEKIDNILVITGDPVPQNGEGLIKSVFCLNSFNLINYINSLNTEVFSEAPYYIGGALNINSTNFEIELERAKRKIQSGAQFLLTQSAFSDKSIENLRLAKERLDCKLLVGIMPLAGYKNAVFINNEVPGIEIPDALIRLFKDKTPEQSEDISVKFCTEIARKASAFCDGYFIMTPLNKTQLVCSLIKEMRRNGLC